MHKLVLARTFTPDARAQNLESLIVHFFQNQAYKCFHTAPSSGTGCFGAVRLLPCYASRQIKPLLTGMYLCISEVIAQLREATNKTFAGKYVPVY